MKNQNETSKEHVSEPDGKPLVICRCYAVFILDNLGEYRQQSVWFNNIIEAEKYRYEYSRNRPDLEPVIYAEVRFNGI